MQAKELVDAMAKCYHGDMSMTWQCKVQVMDSNNTYDIRHVRFDHDTGVLYIRMEDAE